MDAMTQINDVCRAEPVIPAEALMIMLRASPIAQSAVIALYIGAIRKTSDAKRGWREELSAIRTTLWLANTGAPQILLVLREDLGRCATHLAIQTPVNLVATQIQAAQVI